MKNADRLPDCYLKDEGSNNYKLLELNRQAAEELRKDLQAVSDALDLKQASGKTLDLYGEMLKQKRGQLNDEQYRYMLYARIGRNIIQGDYTSVMDAMILMFGCRQGDIALEDLSGEDRSCIVKLTKFPMDTLYAAGFSSKQAVQMIEQLLPICVTLLADNFEGTFEFATLDHEYDEAAGFADAGSSFGGYLGLLLGEDYEGSFEFARLDKEYDASAGFADEKQTTGGYLGALIDIGVLPI